MDWVPSGEYQNPSPGDPNKVPYSVLINTVNLLRWLDDPPPWWPSFIYISCTRWPEFPLPKSGPWQSCQQRIKRHAPHAIGMGRLPRSNRQGSVGECCWRRTLCKRESSIAFDKQVMIQPLLAMPLLPPLSLSLSPPSLFFYKPPSPPLSGKSETQFELSNWEKKEVIRQVS